MRDRLAGRHTLPGVAANGSGRIQVVTHHHDRAVDFAHPHQRAQGNHLVPAVAHLKFVDILDAMAILTFGLKSDLPVATEPVEAIDIERPQVNLRRLVDILDTHAERLNLGAVHVHVIHGRLRAKLVNTPIRAGSPRILSTRASVSVCKAVKPSPPRSSTINLNPPATPRPGIGGAPKTVTSPSCTCRLHSRRR